MGLSNAYLEKIGKRILKNRSFKGVYPCDLTPNIDYSKKFSIIINTGTSDTNGEHFIAIYADSKKLIYFDSFGMKPDNKYLVNFIKSSKKKRKLFFNLTQIQDHSSNFCGFYCLAFLMSAYKNNYLNFINCFSKRKLKANDQIVVKFILKNII